MNFQISLSGLLEWSKTWYLESLSWLSCIHSYHFLSFLLLTMPLLEPTIFKPLDDHPQLTNIDTLLRSLFYMTWEPTQSTLGANKKVNWSIAICIICKNCLGELVLRGRDLEHPVWAERPACATRKVHQAEGGHDKSWQVMRHLPLSELDVF